ncbi:hypothetical protein [Hymenobacter glacieicola]|uniref:Uncharacterized protein n=1 Tax=Hymenobacter glacieicola TaxID=1562124 RepID=A0ABQ1X793_9BACT|nr:hypothetical protein [Hymenobacter glacieicola]GGG59647.1 hypothetical protein GCM10011378_39550 [Hymenobacter glacieicola]
MRLVLPPADTAARQAMTDQGNALYPGVDHWEHPRKGLPAGKMLVQFDFRDADVIRRSPTTASVYFTDADTLLKYLTENDQVRARGLAEALQVGPYRADSASPHRYSQNVALYQLQRELRAEQVHVAQPAEFGQGLTRNNLHWGDGVGQQFFLAIPRDQLRTGATPLLQLSGVLPCIDREHRLEWMKRVEQQPGQDVKEAVAKAFESQVEQLLRGSPAQQQRGREIAELVKARRSFATPLTDHPSLKKLPRPPLTPVAPTPSPAPKPRRRGPHF